MKPTVLYKCSKSTSPFEKLGSKPFSTFLCIIWRTQSSACNAIVTLSFNRFKYSCSLLLSRAILAKFTVLTLTEPTFSAVPPIELKSSYSILSYGLDHFLYATRKLTFPKAYQ